ALAIAVANGVRQVDIFEGLELTSFTATVDNVSAIARIDGTAYAHALAPIDAEAFAAANGVVQGGLFVLSDTLSVHNEGEIVGKATAHATATSFLSDGGFEGLALADANARGVNQFAVGNTSEELSVFGSVEASVTNEAGAIIAGVAHATANAVDGAFE